MQVKPFINKLTLAFTVTIHVDKLSLHRSICMQSINSILSDASNVTQ